jgi:flagellin
MRIQNNVTALNAHRNYTVNQANAAKSIAKLSSGYRINSAADDAAGLAISEKMRSQIRGLNMASKNSQDAISLIQTAEGGMQEIDNMVQRIRELTVYAANDTQDQSSTTATSGDRKKIQDEIDQLTQEIDSMANRVEFNKKKLINGSFTGGLESDQKAYTEAASTLNAARQDLINFVGGSTWDGLIADARSVAAQVSAAAEAEAAAASTTSYASVANSISDLEKLIGEFDELVSKALTTTDVSDLDSSTNTNSIEMALDDLKSKINTVLSDWYAAASTASNTTLGTAITALGTTFSAAMGTGNTYTPGTAILLPSGFNGRFHNLEVASENYTSTKSVVDNSVKSGLYFQVGANADQSLELSIGSVKTDMLGIGDGYGNSLIDVMKTSGKGITYQLDILDEALTYVTTQRSKLGAAQNRLEYTQSSLDISAENLTAAESRIRDVDMAKEMTNFTKQNILFQASTAMLAQANAFPQGVLQLLG